MIKDIKYYKTREEAFFQKIKESKSMKFHIIERATSPDNIEYCALTNEELDDKFKALLVGQLIKDYEKLPEDCQETFKKFIL